MTKIELRKARKVAQAAGLPLTGELTLNTDKDSGPMEYGSERQSNGRINIRRANALHRHARYVYEYDRD